MPFMGLELDDDIMGLELDDDITFFFSHSFIKIQQNNEVQANINERKGRG